MDKPKEREIKQCEPIEATPVVAFTGDVPPEKTRKRKTKKK